MDNKAKKIIIAILLIILVVIALNFQKIKFTLSMLDAFKVTEDKDYVDEDNGKETLTNPLDDFLHADQKELSESDEQENIETDNDDILEQDTEGKNDDEQANDTGKSKEDIVRKYNEELASIQSKFEGDLYGLIGQAKDEYLQGNTNSTSLGFKYIGLATNLEQACDSQVYGIIDNMEKDLKDNGHTTELADYARSYYKSFKTAQKESLLSEVKKYM